MTSEFFDTNEIAEIVDDMQDVQSVCFKATDGGIRADVALTALMARQMKSFTRSRVQKLFEANRVMVNGQSADSNTKIKVGDEITVELPPIEDIDIVPEDIPLDIVFEDEYFAVISKPKGMVVHPAPGHTSGTLVNAIMFRIKDLSGIGGQMRPGIVHRIDKLTSGLIAIAKNDIAHASLSAQIKAHTAKRTYVALVVGNIKQDNGIIDVAIGRHPKDRKKMAAFPNPTATCRDATTYYHVLQRFMTYTLVEAKLKTGRTHQIRVHMAYMKHPVAGDDVYGSGNGQKNWGVEGQMLHAVALELDHPKTGERMHFFAPLPQYFVDAVAKLDKTHTVCDYINGIYSSHQS